ncbi:proline racemase [Clostridium scatologenes]|uniref:Proline racemase n=1 Tax=Clostridium scatologenes TaxID=1548 RepID=A0A0E3JQP5_CLOSL|nr:proline racemase [Clostridium scatologenes]AKA71104.1 proline racemase [Clostridium scatologenes]
MKATKVINTVESHTMGEPTRIVTGGVPKIPGKTMAEKMEYMEKNMDYLRTMLMLEPRGHNDMFGAIFTEPCVDEADIGVIFMDGGGYLNMCGHGSIGSATCAVEMGMVPVTEPYTDIVLEAPAGIIKARVKVENGKAKEVSIVNVAAFLYKKDIEVNVPDFGKLTLDISFGGSFFAMVKASDVGIDLIPKNAQQLNDLGMKIIHAVNEQVEIQHPILKHIKTVDLCEFYAPAKSEDADVQNVVVFGQGQVDRSPCGTGTSAKLADLYARGEIEVGGQIVNESIICTKFTGKILGKAKVGEFDGIIPEITGSAYVTGFSQYLVDPDDPVKHGFILK